MAKFKIHFIDNYGTGTVECETREQFNECYSNIQNDPMCDNIWCEYYDEEEGWQA